MNTKPGNRVNLYQTVLSDAAQLRAQRKEKRAATTYHDPHLEKWRLLDKARALVQELKDK